MNRLMILLVLNFFIIPLGGWQKESGKDKSALETEKHAPVTSVRKEPCKGTEENQPFPFSVCYTEEPTHLRTYALRRSVD